MKSVYSTALIYWATGHLLGGVLPLCRDEVSVFYSPNLLGHRTLVGCCLTPFAEMKSVYSIALIYWPQDTCWVVSYPFAEMKSVYSTALIYWATGHLLGGVLPLCRDEVSVFYSLNLLGHRTLVGWCLTPLQRWSQCILQP